MGWLEYLGFRKGDKKECTIYEELKLQDNFQLIKDVCNQVFSLFHDSSFLVLFPRMDFKGLGYVPQLFFIHPKRDLLISSISVTTTDKPTINYLHRNAKYASYNIISQPQVITLNKAILTSVPSMLLSYLKRSIFFNYVLTFESNLIKEQLKERVMAGVPFTIYSPSIGFHELAVITSLNTNSTPYIDEVEISCSLKIIKTFNIIEKGRC